MRQQSYKIILTVTLGFLLSFSAANAKNFNIFNAASPSQSYFMVNGTSGNVGIGITNPTTLLQILNNGWISAQNAAGTGVVNMFKVNASNQIEVGAPLNIGSFEFSPDSGLVSFVDMPVTSGAASGTPEGYAFKVDGDNIMTAYSESNGTGGIQNKRLGIGLTNPTTALDVSGSLRNTLATTHSLLGGAGEVLVMADNSGNLYATSTAGFLGGGTNLWGGTTGGKIWNANYGHNVGMGTTNPFRKLDINQGIDGTQLQVRNNGADTLSQSAGIQFSLADSGVTTDEYAKGALFFKGDGSDWGRGDFIFALDNAADAGNASTSDAKMVIRKDGNVGIGTTNPQNKLQIIGGNVGIGTAFSNGLLNFEGNSTTTVISATRSDNSQPGYLIFDGWGNFSFNKKVGIGTTDSLFGSTADLYVNGNVGIGTTAPAAKLEVRNQTVNNTPFQNLQTIFANVSNESSGESFTATNASFGLSFRRNWNGGADSSNVAGIYGFSSANYRGGMVFRTKDNTSSTGDTDVTAMMISPVGNIGIGTTNPTTKLYIAGTSLNTLATTHSLLGGAGNVLVMADNTGALYATSTAGFSGGTNFWGGTKNANIWNGDAGAGNVGIGTTNPGYNLEVSQASTGTIAVRSTNWTANNKTRFIFRHGGTLGVGTGAEAVVESNLPGGDDVDLLFKTWSNGSSRDTLFLDGDGSVGIGLTNPGYPLDVNGSIRASQGDIISTNSGSYANMRVQSYSDTAWQGSRIEFFRARGTSAAQTAVASGDTIGWFDFYAYDGSASNRAAQFNVIVDGTVSSGIIPGRFSLSTVDSTGTNRNRFTAYSNDNITMANNGGNVGIGIVSATTKLYVAGTSLNTLATTHSLLGGAGDVVVMADNTGALYATSTASLLSGGTSLWSGTKNGNIWNGDSGAGNIGIGTTNPISQLELYKNTGAGLRITGDVNSTSTLIDLLEGTGAFGAAGTYGFRILYNGSSNYFNLNSGNGTMVNTRMAIDRDTGNVGLGVATPGAKLDINQGSYGLPQTIATSTQTYGALRIQAASGGNVTLDMGNGGSSSGAWLQVTNRTDLSLAYSLLLNPNGGNVGVGTTNPGTKLDVSGTLRNTLATTHSLLGGGGEVLVMADNAGNLYATSTAGFIGGSGSYLPLTGGSLSGNLNMGGNNITNVNKLTVNTIDPLYNIQGINYSTFASSIAGGVKEEYVGRVKINKLTDDGEREYIIDFDNLTKGSDLWVWRKTVDFSVDNVEVIATPYGNFAQVYYKIEGNKIIFRADKATTISYRLSGRRVDWRNWPTKALDQEEKAGFVIE